MAFFHSFRLLVLAFAVIIMTACQGVSPVVTQPAADQAATTEPENQDQPVALPDLGVIKIGYLPIASHATVFVAQEKGYFAEQGLTVELVPFQAGPDFIAPLAVGELDASQVEQNAGLFNALARDLDIQTAASIGVVRDESFPLYLVARKDLHDSGEVTELADLAGRKISLPSVRGLGEYLLADALSEIGLSIDDVELIPLPFPEVPGALVNGAVDVAFLSDPLAQQVIQEGIGVSILQGRQITGQIQAMSALVLGKRLLEPANREVAVRLLTAIFKAIRLDLNDNYNQDAEIAAILETYTKVPVAAIQRSNPVTFVEDGKLDEDSMMRFQTYYRERGYTDYDEMIPFADLTDPSLIQEAIRRLEQAGE